MPIPGSRTRVPGSGFTVFHWNDGSGDKVIGFARQVTVAGVQPVADPVVIQPLNMPQPVEIVTPGAHTNGVITLTLTDLYNQAVWQRLAGLADSQDIVDIMRYVASIDQGVKISKYINPPQGLSSAGPYVETFYDCVVARVNDNETIDVTTMTIEKEVEVWYTYSRKNWINGGKRKFPLVY